MLQRFCMVHTFRTIIIPYLFSGLERKAFDNKNVTFEEHIRREHNMWHYLYFIVLIKVKDPTEFTGPESYVHEMVKVSTSLHKKLQILDKMAYKETTLLLGLNH